MTDYPKEKKTTLFWFYAEAARKLSENKNSQTKMLKDILLICS